jgi:dipeptidyl aminopeptidase/acylaminoacyl peptidase
LTANHVSFESVIFMKHSLPLYIFLALGFVSKGQGRLMTFNNLRHWPSIGSTQISSDGRVAAYVIQSDADPSVLVVQATDGSWIKQIGGGNRPAFSSDNEFLLFLLNNDSLGIFSIREKTWRALPGINNYQIPRSGSGRWVAVEAAHGDSVILVDLMTGVRESYAGMGDFQFSPAGQGLLLHIRKPGTILLEQLIWVDLPSGCKKVICTGAGRISQFTFDDHGNDLAFYYSEDGGESVLMYYRVGSDSANILAAARTRNMPVGMSVVADPCLRFTPGGRYLLFGMNNQKPRDTISKDSLKTIPVIVWNSGDDFLPTDQAKSDPYDAAQCAAVAMDADHKVVKVTDLGDRRWTIAPGQDCDMALVVSFIGNEAEGYWRLESRLQVFLVSLRDGSRRQVVKDLLSDYTQPAFSPEGKFVLWYDEFKGAYYSFDVASSLVANISAQIPNSLGMDMNGKGQPPQSVGVCAWEAGDASVFLYDGFDVWQVDPLGKSQPKNVTGYYGRTHQTQLRCVADYTGSGSELRNGNTMRLQGVNLATKDLGFYSVVLGHPESLRRLMTARLRFDHYPKKAQNAESYLVELESADQYPNLFSTHNFKVFRPLSNLQPQRSVRWYTTQLIHWKAFDGSQLNGVLFKPDDFDSTKRYKVLFLVYEEMSWGLNAFFNPKASSGAINIPWFVNHGYVVCTPDIHYNRGSPGESAFNCVVSCAKYLSAMPWVDSTRMGIQGHSFGGYEVNYILTRTNCFAAACSAAGASDLASLTYSLTRNGGESVEWVSEWSQNRLAGPVWAPPGEYVRNSPLYFADQVTTPLLMMHNDRDGQVPWAQGIEWFLGLRRLQKPVWMLQYHGEGHALSRLEDQKDYTEKLMQFFDHYLKDDPLPVWMLPEH